LPTGSGLPEDDGLDQLEGSSGLSLRSDNLDSVGELYTEDDFRQLVGLVEVTPAFLGGLGELDDHGEVVGPVRGGWRSVERLEEVKLPAGQR
jgi:hypothetical protein